MSGLQALSGKLIQIETDIRSTKVLIHQKGLEKFDQILNDRSTELTELLSNHDTFQFCTTWTNWLDTLHEAVVQQSYKCVELPSGCKLFSAVENRNPLHSNVLQKFLNLANETNLNIPLDAILEKCFHCFGDRTIAKYFGDCYLYILQRNILGSSTGNIGDIKISDWSRKYGRAFPIFYNFPLCNCFANILLLVPSSLFLGMVSYCFQLNENGRIRKLYVLQALSLVIDCGCKYTQFGADLHQYIPKMMEIVAEDHKFTSQKELIKLCHYFCRNVS